MPHYTKDPKRDHNFDNHPYREPILMPRENRSNQAEECKTCEESASSESFQPRSSTIKLLELLIPLFGAELGSTKRKELQAFRNPPHWKLGGETPLMMREKAESLNLKSDCCARAAGPSQSPPHRRGSTGCRPAPREPGFCTV